ncbi:DUF6668 family protein [Nocardia niigatensis]
MAAPIAHGEPAPTRETVVVPVGLNVPSTAEQTHVHTQPIATTTPAPALWLLGAHGGAGVSTLSHTWAPAGDALGGWPSLDRHRGVVIVARTHRHGLSRAHLLLRQAAAQLVGDCVLLGLLTVADHAGTLPPILRRHRDLVEELAPAAWRVPFIPEFRLVTAEQLPIWSPRDPVDAETRGRFARRPNPSTTVHPDLVAIGTEVFAAARRAATPSP